MVAEGILVFLSRQLKTVTVRVGLSICQFAAFRERSNHGGIQARVLVEIQFPLDQIVNAGQHSTIAYGRRIL